MKTEFTLTLFDDEYVRKKLDFLSRLEAMFDDDRNPLPDDYYYFSDGVPFGATIKVTLEDLDKESS